jgi:hypothetical protein
VSAAELEPATHALKGIANPITNNNLHVQLTPAGTQTDVLFASDLILLRHAYCNGSFGENGATGVNLLHAIGRDAKQSVLHFHIHVIPRYLRDGLELWLKNRV